MLWKSGVPLEIAATTGALWLRWRRLRHRRHARPLTAGERRALRPFFEPPLLDRVRVAGVERIKNPFGHAIVRRAWPGRLLDLETVSGMALCDTVVISLGGAGAEADMDSLLFHELVHMAQFEVLGVRAFVRKYIGGWVDNGCAYHAIPLERDAYELQARYRTDPGRGFDVMAEVRRRLGRLR